MRRTRTRAEAPRAKPPVQTPSVVGIDPSLRCTGYAYREEGQPYTGHIKSDKVKGARRLRAVKLQVGKVIDYAEPVAVFYENYAFGARGNNMFNIGELGGVLQLDLWERGLTVYLINPKTLKEAITGKGNADKPAMRQAVYELYGFVIDQEDEVDAFCLMAFGEALLYRRGPEVVVRRVLTKSSSQKPGIQVVEGMRAVV